MVGGLRICEQVCCRQERKLILAGIYRRLWPPIDDQYAVAANAGRAPCKVIGQRADLAHQWKGSHAKMIWILKRSPGACDPIRFGFLVFVPGTSRQIGPILP